MMNTLLLVRRITIKFCSSALCSAPHKAENRPLDDSRLSNRQWHTVIVEGCKLAAVKLPSGKNKFCRLEAARREMVLPTHQFES